MSEKTEATLGPDEDAFLRAHSRTFLLGLRADGSPTGWPMVGMYPGEVLEFSTYRRSQKVRDFERNPNVCCVVAPVDAERALVLRGTAVVPPDQREPTGGLVPRPGVVADDVMKRAAEARLASGKRVVVRFTPRDTIRAGMGRTRRAPGRHQVSRSRPDIHLTAGEIAAFLDVQARVVVVALDKGEPVGTVASAELVDGEWKVTLGAGDDVARLLAVDDRVCVLVDQYPSYYEIKGVTAHGRAQARTVVDGRLTFTLPLDDVTTFDFAKLPREGAGSGRTIHG